MPTPNQPSQASKSGEQDVAPSRSQQRTVSTDARAITAPSQTLPLSQRPSYTAQLYPPLESEPEASTAAEQGERSEQGEHLDAHPEGVEGGDEEAKLRPEFSPFFTLINDVGTQSTMHPRRIHYIFSDDDSSELLTSSLLDSLQQDTILQPKDSRESLRNSEEESRDGTSGSSSSTTFRKEHPRGKGKSREKEKKKKTAKAEREERVVIVDINDSGDGIAGVSSLSPNWQVLNVQLDSAPTFDGAGTDGAEAGEKGLMLRIEGVGPEAFVADDRGKDGLGITPGEKGKGMSGSGTGSALMSEEEMQTILEGFDRKMAVLRRIVSAGEENASALDRGKEGEVADEVRASE